MAFSVQDTNELGTPFPTDWMVMTIIRSSIQRSTTNNNTVRGLVTCRWNENEVELVPDPTAAPEANTSEGSLVQLAVGSEIQVRGLINVRAHFQGQGSRRHRKPVLSMTLDVKQIRLDGDGGDGGRSPSPRTEGGLGGEERPPRKTPPPPDVGSRSGRKRPHISTEDGSEGGGGERGDRPSDPKRLRPWSSEDDDAGGSGPQGSSTDGGPHVPSSSYAQPTPSTSSATPRGGGGGTLGSLGMSSVAAVAPASPICPLNLEADILIQTHYFDGYGRLLNGDGSAQERMHTLFTFRQNRASGNAHWLHVLATRNLEERQLNLAVWEEIIFPNPANTSKTDKGPRRGTLQMIFVNRRIPPSHLPEEPNETWPLEPIYIITLDSHGALANAEYIRDGTIDQDDIHPRYLFEQHFNNGARRNIHVVLITQKDETQFEYQVWEEYLAAGALSPIWRPMVGQGQILNGINREEYMARLIECTRSATAQPTSRR
ncbi:hypothetical protein BGZ74_002428 [Mortierella antarctica]|nr:hypothetical protein BGZ74_002428 [Mortierella antarctica]